MNVCSKRSSVLTAVADAVQPLVTLHFGLRAQSFLLKVPIFCSKEGFVPCRPSDPVHDEAHFTL